MRGESKDAIEMELVAAERDLGRLRLIRDRATHRIQDLVREQQRLRNHLAVLEREDNQNSMEVA
jgi:hypothetical protein